MKKRYYIFLILVLVMAINLPVQGVSPSKYLNSRLIVLSSKLLQEISVDIDKDDNFRYNIGLLPLMNVNGENDELAAYLSQQFEDVISGNPFLNLVSSSKTFKVWNELQNEELSEADLFKKMGRRLQISGLIMVSLVTHPQSYNIKALVVNTNTGAYRNVELIDLERKQIDLLPYRKGVAIEIPGTTDTITHQGQNLVNTGDKQNEVPDSTSFNVEETGNEMPYSTSGEDVTEGNFVSETGAESNDVSLKPKEGSSNYTSTDQLSDQSAQDAAFIGYDGNTGNENQLSSKDDTSNFKGDTSDISTDSIDTDPAEESQPFEEELAIAKEFDSNSSTKDSSIDSSTLNILNLQKDLTSSLKLTTQSPVMDNLILGYAIGDLDGDGSDELVYSGGNYLQVRNLTDYTILWTKTDYLPSSNDHKLLTVDLDNDGKAEVISHGNLLEIEEDQLISGHPRFISRPVALYGQNRIALFSQGVVYIVNHQGLIIKKYQLGNNYGKRFVFADIDNDGVEEFITTVQNEDEIAFIQIFEVGEILKNPLTLNLEYGFAIHVMDLNSNGFPEIYLRRNYFDGNLFLYSKIFVLEMKDGKLSLISETPPLDYFIVDFASYPSVKPSRLVVGGMYLKDKSQLIQEIKSRLFFYTLE